MVDARSWSSREMARRADQAIAKSRELCKEARLIREETVKSCHHSFNIMSTFLGAAEWLQRRRLGKRETMH